MPDPATPEAKAPEADPKSLLAEAPEKTAAPVPDPAKTPEAKAEPAKPDEKKVEPLDIKLPDGFSADPALLDEFKKLAAETGLNAENAQKLVAFQGKINAAAQAAQKKEADDFGAKEAAWRTEAQKIPAADLGLAKRAMLNLTKDMPPELRDETRQILQGTWMGNHPGVLRLLASAGKFVAEDKIVEEGTAGKAPFTAADFYPTMKKK